MSKNVCFLVSEHPFLDARIFKKEAKSLMNHGYQVTMIVPRKHGYLFDVDGSIFKDKFRSQTFIHEGIKIITYEQIYLNNQLKSLAYNLRHGNHLRFTDPLTQLGTKQKADIYHAHEFFSLYSGVGIKRSLSTLGKTPKLIYDSHELEPDPLAAKSDKIKKVMKQMLEHMVRETDYVITVSDSIKSWFQSIDSRLQIEVIYNSPSLATNYEPKQATKPGLLLAYEGMLSPKRVNFRKLMNIVEMCNKKFELKVKIIGGNKHSSGKKNMTLPPHLKDKILFTGWVNYHSIPQAMEDVDVGWIDLDAVNSLNNRFAMPNKFFSYLNNGVPALVNQCTDMEKFIATNKCGYVIKKLHATAEDYVKALEFLHANRSEIKNMGLQARKVMESQYSWEHMEKKLFKVYEQVSQK